MGANWKLNTGKGLVGNDEIHNLKQSELGHLGIPNIFSVLTRIRKRGIYWSRILELKGGTYRS